MEKEVARDLRVEGKDDSGCASSTLKLEIASWKDVRAPSHFSLAESLPEQKRVILYPLEEEFFSNMTAESGSSKPVRYQKSEAWRNL